ncbi:MAG: hypothetical protein AVDCRST_MAG85-2047 [uncultured Solirubrobacteraceae bacterium]|uniref:Uncharacterized protein n=1 Tax=uncultured Solirubrobacteraceae bacterium TaxID=1162706 RepID=A0A6J4SV01_9ACTN|nr:MAG: hypothetical protein AVDCRST_MAG85-2047 [uncultured Solirubrobacteraceae bacterium]
MPVETPPTPRFSRVLEGELRERASRRRRRRSPSLPPLIAAAAVVAAFVFVLLPTADETGEQASPPPKPLTVTTEQLLSGDRAMYRRLQREFEALGKRLIVREEPVSPHAEIRGHATGVQTPPSASPGAGEPAGPIVVDELDGPIIVTIAVADPDEKTAGLTIYEAIPGLCALVDGKDPDGTIRRLRAAGFEVDVERVRWDTPEGEDVVVSVLDGKSRFTGASPDAKQLTVEVGDPGEGHAGEAGC